MLSTHLGDGAERAEPVTSLGYFEVGIMLGSCSQACGVFKRLDRCRAENTFEFFNGNALFASLGADTFKAQLNGLSNLFPTKDAHQVVESGYLIAQPFTVAFRQTTGGNDCLHLPAGLQFNHFTEHAQRFLPRRLNESAGIHDHDICFGSITHQGETLHGKFSEHSFGIHEIFRAPQAYERKSATFAGSR